MNDCIFCKIVKGEIPAIKIKETENTLSFLDTHPLNLGHALVIPKKHYENIFDVTPEILAQVIIETKKIASAVKKAVNANGIGIAQNNGKAAGQVVNHLHFHIIPRYNDDGYVHWSPYKDTPSNSAVAEKIIQAL